MNANNKKLLCSKCRRRVSYHVHKRPNQYVIKGSEVNYEEYYATCDECTEEIFVPGLEDANVERIDQAYREKNHLITKKNIEEIMSRYNIDKRPLSKLLGLGELTITRYLDGQLPSQKYSDMLYEILCDEQKLEEYIEQNQNSVSEVTVKKVSETIQVIRDEKILSVLSQADLEDLLSDKEKNATNYVLETLGIYNVWFLKYLTHIELPWREARGELDENDKSNNVIDAQCMNDYFECMNKKYHLERPDGAERYIKDMKMEMYHVGI